MKEEWKVYIKGVQGRGEEVKQALINLGGYVVRNYNYTVSYCLYYINHNGEIRCAEKTTEIGKIIMDNYREIILSGPWEDGDILIKKGRTEYTIFRKYSSNTMFCSYNFTISKNEHIWFSIAGEEHLYKTEDFRLATSEEIKQFHDLLHKMNRYWDSEKKHLVKLKQKPTLSIFFE